MKNSTLKKTYYHVRVNMKEICMVLEASSEGEAVAKAEQIAHDKLVSGVSCSIQSPEVLKVKESKKWPKILRRLKNYHSGALTNSKSG